MGFITKILNKIFYGISNAVNNMDKKTVKTVKQSYIMLIVILAAIGGFIGYKNGKNTARIKSAPLAEYINDVFQIDINREKREGRFGRMLESELINEMKYTDQNKIQFPTKETFKPEFEHRIIEPDRDKKISADPRMEPLEKQMEGSYRDLNKLNPDVKPLRGNENPVEKKREDKKEDDRLYKSVIEEDKTRTVVPEKDKPIDKIRTDRKKRELAPIKDNSGILDK